MDLSAIKKSSEIAKNRGTMTTVFGDAGVGKTTFSVLCWPKPVVVPIEWGLGTLEVDSFPQPTSTVDVLKALDSIGEGVATGAVDYKTIILDTVSQLDGMFETELCDEGKVESLNKYGGGYGTGPAAHKRKHKDLRMLVEDLLMAGIHFVAISHADIKRIDPPDGESYDQWHLQMTKAGRDLWVSQADAVMHLKAPIAISNVNKHDKRRVAKDVGVHRVIDMAPSASTTAKNRYSVNEEINFYLPDESGNFVNPISHIFNF